MCQGYNTGIIMTLNISSSQQPIIPSAPIISEVLQNDSDLEISTEHSWNFNNFRVNLININNTRLECETIESDRKESMYRGPVEIPSSLTLARMISKLKLREVIVNEDYSVDFLPKYRTWKIENQDVSLLRDDQDLIWKIFNTFTYKVSLFNLAEQTTIPSKRCHPDTVALIERIKKDYSNGNNLKILIEDFHVVNVLDIATCRKEHEELEKIINKLESDYNISLRKSEKTFDTSLKVLIIPGVLSEAVSLFAFWSRIVNIAKLYGVAVAAGAGYGALIVGCATALVPGLIAIGAKSIYDEHKMAKNKNKKEVPLKREFIKETNRLNRFSIERPLFVEIEPISVESLINRKVRVSKFTWAVTLVIVGGCYDTSIKTHAELYIEGIYDGCFKAIEDSGSSDYQNMNLNNNEYFLHVAHLTHKGIQSFPIVNPNSFISHIKERSEIWMKPAKEINQMFNRIQQQKAKETPTNKNFSVLGKESFLSNEHNCITFCLENLKTLNIYPPRNLGDKIADTLIFTDPIRYTKKLDYYKDELITVQI